MVIAINSVIGGVSWEHLIWLADVTVRLQVSDCSQLSDSTVQLQPSTIITEKTKQLMDQSNLHICGTLWYSNSQIPIHWHSRHKQTQTIKALSLPEARTKKKRMNF